MKFAAIRFRIFMVGGHETDDSRSRKVFIYDTLEYKLQVGPPLNSGKYYPFVFGLGSKLFALSRLVYCIKLGNEAMDPEPLFEMMDTNNLSGGWCPLRVPRLEVYPQRYVYLVKTCATVSLDEGSRNLIFVSISNAWTYVFEVDERSHVSTEPLPFSGLANTIPHAPHLSCAPSLTSRRIAAFRFYYGSEGFGVDEIEINHAYDDNMSHVWPELSCMRPALLVFGLGERVYFVSSGVDVKGNRYVPIYSIEIASLKSNKRKWLIKHGEGGGDVKEVKLINSREIRFLGGPVCDPMRYVAAAFSMKVIAGYKPGGGRFTYGVMAAVGDEGWVLGSG